MALKIDYVEKLLPHLVCECMCWKCGHRWIGVFPESTQLKQLECPECHNSGFVFCTGQVMPDED